MSGRASPNFSAKLQFEPFVQPAATTVGLPRFWAFLLTLCTRRSPNMELNPIVLARSSILCRKIFPNQGGVRTKGPLKELGNRVAIPVRRLARSVQLGAV